MRAPVVLPLLVCAIGLAGCAAGVGAAPLFLLSALALFVGGCAKTKTCGDGRTPSGGSCVACCISGTLSTCYCPSNVACNYGWNSCLPDAGNDASTDAAVDDASVDASYDATVDASRDASMDAGGTWEACCVDGRIETCYCPANAACNYGWFTACEDNMCVAPTEECP